MGLSVLLSVYHKENPSYMSLALQSIMDQTLIADEIVLVKDGPLTPLLDETIATFVDSYPSVFKIVTLEENKGLGAALKIGVNHCSHEIIARMDTDDIARSNRFQKQFEFLSQHTDIDVVGSNIEEFNKVPKDLSRFKYNPEKHEELVRQIKLRSPFNHPSIMFRKSSLLKAGNYNGDILLFEDYSLFLRMWKKGLKFHNIQEVLLDFRVGSGIDTIKRRSGMHYLQKESKFLKYAKSIGAFDSIDILKYKILKFPIRLLPPKVVLFIYNTFLRTRK